jgi:hypothetical protein
MPLLDHFHPPLADRRAWESFHAAWIVGIADTLNEDLLPDEYFAETQIYMGPRVEIDVATFSSGRPEPGGGTAVATYAPPAPRVAVPAAIPDEFSLSVFGTARGGANLVAAIELVSPANKDRDDTRRAFATKCAA